MIQTKQSPISLPVTEQAEITDSGLKLPANLSFDSWLQVGRKLMLADRAVQWAIGDWWIYGDHRYGERASAAIDPATGENRLTRYMDYGWVARSVETSRRREVLSWSAHKEVAALEPDIQDAILDRAVENGWGSREVRAAVKEYKAQIEAQNEASAGRKVIEIEEAEVVSETGADDKPVFDNGAASERMSAEDRREVLTAFAEQDLSEPRQFFLKALDMIDAASKDETVRNINLKNVNVSRLRSIARRLEWLAQEADGIQNGKPPSTGNPPSRPVEKGRMQPPVSSPPRSRAKAAPAVSRVDAGRIAASATSEMTDVTAGRDRQPASQQPEHEGTAKVATAANAGGDDVTASKAGGSPDQESRPSSPPPAPDFDEIRDMPASLRRGNF